MLMFIDFSDKNFLKNFTLGDFFHLTLCALCAYCCFIVWVNGSFLLFFIQLSLLFVIVLHRE